MNRTLDLIVWAIPYSMAWSLKAIGIDLKDSFPTMAKAENKQEEFLQQGIAVAAVGLLTIPTLGTAGLVITSVLAATKVYNLIRIDLNN